MPLGPFAPQFGFNLTTTSATFIVGGITAVTNYSAPTNAIAFLLQADDANTGNIRWRIGAAASATLGHQMEPGRDSGPISYGSTLSICPELGASGSLSNYYVTWFIGS